jgi:hypothetical protein
MDLPKRLPVLENEMSLLDRQGGLPENVFVNSLMNITEALKWTKAS